MSINWPSNNQSSFSKLPSINDINKNIDLYKLNFNIENKEISNRNINGNKKLEKKGKKKNISFYCPKINSLSSDSDIKLHMTLYDTFRKFGESHSKSVIKNIKKINY